MSRASYKDIRDAVISVFSTIKTANGYVNTLDSAKFKKLYDPNAMSVQAPSFYPKFFFLIDEGMPVQQIGQRVRKTVYFTVICVVIHDKVNNGAEPQDQILSIQEDVELAIVQNYNLLGKAISWQMRNFRVDSGVTYPEGNLIMEIAVTFDDQY